MVWLSFWRTLLALGFEEAIIASCQFGCLHRKEFRFLLYLLDAVFSEARCQGGHHHIRIEGKWIKGSAVYVDGLGQRLASAFAKALRLESADDEHVVHDFESLVVNDPMDSSHWTLGRSGTGRSMPIYIYIYIYLFIYLFIYIFIYLFIFIFINVYETDASVVALESVGCRRPHSRACFVVDSLVAKGALSKGRSSAKKLPPALKHACAIQIAFDTYPGWCYPPIPV